MSLYDRLALIRRLVRQRLLIPILRLRHRPEYAARGTCIGLAWAFTPTFGIRMPLVVLTWLVARHLCRWDFSLILGLAWTWSTNALVVLPIYVTFFLTGRALLGHWQDLAGLSAFREQIAHLIRWDGSLGERIAFAGQLVFHEWGATLWLGALPWSLLMATLGYVGALRFLRRRTLRRRSP